MNLLEKLYHFVCYHNMHLIGCEFRKDNKCYGRFGLPFGYRCERCKHFIKYNKKFEKMKAEEIQFKDVYGGKNNG